MNFSTDINIGNWLNQLNGKTVKNIFQVDYNNRHEDIYLPCMFFISFKDFDLFLEIEGDFDGDHIKINFFQNSELEKKIKENTFEEPDLWCVHSTGSQEKIGLLLGQKIEFIEYGKDKKEYEIKGVKFKGQNDVFNFITFNCENLKLTIFESLGLAVSDDPDLKLMFEDTFDRYKT